MMVCFCCLLLACGSKVRVVVKEHQGAVIGNHAWGVAPGAWMCMGIERVRVGVGGAKWTSMCMVPANART